MATQDIVQIIAAFLMSGILTFGATPLTKLFAQKVGAIDVPKDERRMHSEPIPRLGGLAIFLGFLLTAVLFSWLNGDLTMQMRGILIGAVVIVVLGVLDDIMDIRWYIKFPVQIISAIIPVACGVRIEILSTFGVGDAGLIPLSWLSIPFTIIWIVGLTNAVNFIDGLDGLAAGVSTIACFTLLVISVITSSPEITLIVAILAGSCVGFLPYNINPAKIFMGDSGATFLGFTLACISIQGLFKFYAVISFLVPFAILALPLFDTLFAIVRRVSKGKSPTSPDRGHLHHRLVDRGFTTKQAVAILYALSAILGLTAVVLTTSGIIRVVLLLVTLMLGFLVWAFIRATSEAVKNGNGNANDHTNGRSAPTIGDVRAAVQDTAQPEPDMPGTDQSSKEK